jgi:molecular chaperone GrpE (heat shock protein)
LAYSIARADGIVQGEEVDRICDLIGQEIESTQSEDHNLREAVLGAAAEFNNLRNNNASAREAFTGFTGFVDANSKVFDSRMKHLSLRVALRIASAHDGVNETELALIEKLKKKLDSID